MYKRVWHEYLGIQNIAYNRLLLNHNKCKVQNTTSKILIVWSNWWMPFLTTTCTVPYKFFEIVTKLILSYWLDLRHPEAPGLATWLISFRYLESVCINFLLSKIKITFYRKKADKAIKTGKRFFHNEKSDWA